MYELPLELVLGLLFISIVFLVTYLPKGGLKGLNMPRPSFSRSKRDREEKLKEIDKKLEEVLSEDFGKEKIVKLDEATEEAAKKFEVRGDLLSEMQSAGSIGNNNINEGAKTGEFTLPNLEAEIQTTEELEKEVKLDQADQREGETKVDFEESDKLLEDIAKEVERKEEEQLDLLRDLKGQKFTTEELESELREMLDRAKKLASKSP